MAKIKSLILCGDANKTTFFCGTMIRTDVERVRKFILIVDTFFIHSANTYSTEINYDLFFKFILIPKVKNIAFTMKNSLRCKIRFSIIKSTDKHTFEPIVN